MQIAVQQGTDKDKEDTEIQPEHEQNKRSQTPVNREGSSVVIDIDRIQIGKCNPQKGDETGTGQLVAKFCLVLRNKTKQYQKVCDEEEKGHGRAYQKSDDPDLTEMWKMGADQIHDLIPVHEDGQAQYDHQGKSDSIKYGLYAAYK